jgi:site-specific DNA-cytosine methylase
MVMQPVAFTRCDNGQDAQVDVTPTMRCGSNYSAHLAVAQLVPDVAPTLDQRAGRSGENSFATSGGLVPVAQPIPIHDQATRHAGKRGEHSDGKGNGLGVGQPGDPAPTLTKGDKHAVAVAFHENQRGELTVNDTAGALKVGGGKPGQGYPAVAFAPDLHPTMVARSSRGGGQTNSPGHNADETLVAFASATEFLPQSSRVYSEAEAAPTLQAAGARMGNRAPQVHAAMQVRRLTPVECERLQGFPDNYTNIPWRKKPEAPDGPRYKSLGNSMAVPCMAWIGRRIDEVETLARGGGA